MRELRDAIKQGAERAERLRDYSPEVGGRYARTALVEPIIEALGWDVCDPDEVRRGYQFRDGDEPVDYALLVRRAPKVFVAVWGPGDDLEVQRWMNRTIGHAVEASAEWVVLTNGTQWRVHNLKAPASRSRQVLIDGDPDYAVDLLRLAAKSTVSSGRVGAMWRESDVDRQVSAELARLFVGDDPAPELVALIERRLPLPDREEIRASLRRARATFDFPETVLPVPEAEKDPAEAKPVAKSRVSPEERRLRIPDLIASGRLRPGNVLHGLYLGQVHYAELLADGHVIYRGEEYGSLSAAAAAVKKYVRGPDTPDSVTNTDGLEFFRSRDVIVGDVVPVKEIRRRTAAEGRAVG